MFALAILVMCGYSCGYEGYENNKIYFGLYTPKIEYGYVISDHGIYLDTVFVRD